MSEDRLDRERNKAIEKAGKEIAEAILKAAKLIASPVKDGQEQVAREEVRRAFQEAVNTGERGSIGAGLE